jgi:hypothetical protein
MNSMSSSTFLKSARKPSPDGALICVLLNCRPPGVILPNLFLFNRRALSDEIRLKGYCVVVIVIKAVFFVSLSLSLLYQIITNPTPLA